MMQCMCLGTERVHRGPIRARTHTCHIIYKQSSVLFMLLMVDTIVILYVQYEFPQFPWVGVSLCPHSLAP